MRVLGHERFCLAGHDRGTYVAQRLALDSPGSVRRLCLMEGIPIAEALARCDARFAASWYHWFFFGQTDKPAERFISADPEAWYTASAEHMGAEAFKDYRRAIHNPETVHAMMEDYRAGLGIDREHDDADRAAGRRIGCPLLFLELRHAQPQPSNARFELSLVDEAASIAVDEAIDPAPKRRHLAIEPHDLLWRTSSVGRLSDASAVLVRHAARIFQQCPHLIPHHLLESIAAHGWIAAFGRAGEPVHVRADAAVVMARALRAIG